MTAKKRATKAKARTTKKRPPLLELVIIGKGRAGTALHKSAHATPWVTSRAWAAREPGWAPGTFFAKACGDVLFLAVPDDAIDDVARAVSTRARLPRIVVHTSGVKGPSALAAIARARPDVVVGTFHPLVSLDGSRAIPEKTLVAVDVAPHEHADEALRTLTDLARRFHCEPAHVAEEKRALYHAGAVVAGNLPVALLSLGVKLLVDAGVPPESARISLARLLKSQAENAIERALSDALTGPVARGDADTVALHLHALDASYPDIARIYRELSRVLVDVVTAHGAKVRAKLNKALE